MISPDPPNAESFRVFVFDAESTSRRSGKSLFFLVNRRNGRFSRAPRRAVPAAFPAPPADLASIPRPSNERAERAERAGRDTLENLRRQRETLQRTSGHVQSATRTADENAKLVKKMSHWSRLGC